MFRCFTYLVVLRKHRLGIPRLSASPNHRHPLRRRTVRSRLVELASKYRMRIPRLAPSPNTRRRTRLVELASKYRRRIPRLVPSSNPRHRIRCRHPTDALDGTGTKVPTRNPAAGPVTESPASTPMSAPVRTYWMERAPEHRRRISRLTGPSPNQRP